METTIWDFEKFCGHFFLIGSLPTACPLSQKKQFLASWKETHRGEGSIAGREKSVVKNGTVAKLCGKLCENDLDVMFLLKLLSCIKHIQICILMNINDMFRGIEEFSMSVVTSCYMEFALEICSCPKRRSKEPRFPVVFLSSTKTLMVLVSKKSRNINSRSFFFLIHSNHGKKTEKCVFVGYLFSVESMVWRRHVFHVAHPNLPKWFWGMSVASPVASPSKTSINSRISLAPKITNISAFSRVKLGTTARRGRTLPCNLDINWTCHLTTNRSVALVICHHHQHHCQYHHHDDSSWWFQPIWKILVKFFTPSASHQTSAATCSCWENISQIGSFPQVGVKIKNVWNHHLVISRSEWWFDLSSFLKQLRVISAWSSSVSDS